MSRRNGVSVGWHMMPHMCNQPGISVSLGDAAPAQPLNLRNALTSEPVKTASAIALTFHGYRRTGSIVWALLYGLAGRTVPVAAVPIALAQGFGQRKACP
jgi:hypothetical protein